MKIYRTFILGIKSLLLHPMRSILTVLGIFIGVASVIWLLAIGEGISQKAQEQIEGLGMGLMHLERAMEDLKQRYDLTTEDLNLDLGPLGPLLRR